MGGRRPTILGGQRRVILFPKYGSMMLSSLMAVPSTQNKPISSEMSRKYRSDNGFTFNDFLLMVLKSQIFFNINRIMRIKEIKNEEILTTFYLKDINVMK